VLKGKVQILGLISYIHKVYFFVSQNPIHASNECRIFKAENVKPQLDQIYLGGILALRCLLLRITNPSAYKSLKALFAENESLTRSPSALQDDITIGKFLSFKCNIKKYMNPNVDKEFLLTFLKVVNACTLKMTELPAHEFKSGVGKHVTRYIRYISLNYTTPHVPFLLILFLVILVPCTCFLKRRRYAVTVLVVLLQTCAGPSPTTPISRTMSSRSGQRFR